MKKRICGVCAIELTSSEENHCTVVDDHQKFIRFGRLDPIDKEPFIKLGSRRGFKGMIYGRRLPTVMVKLDYMHAADIFTGKIHVLDSSTKVIRLNLASGAVDGPRSDGRTEQRLGGLSGSDLTAQAS